MKKLWKYLNGKKSIIGTILHLLWFVVSLLFKDKISTEESIRGHSLIFIITGVGLGHKAVKNKNNIKKLVSKKDV